MPSHEKHVEAVDVEVPATSTMMEETGILQAQEPLDAQDQQEEEEHVKPGLPFSKARAIALVITVTAASFMNVCAKCYAVSGGLLMEKYRRWECKAR